MQNQTLSAGPRALKDALRFIQERFEEGPDADRLAYHNREHTKGVTRRAVKIANAVGLSQRECVLVEIAAAFHDTVQM
ncbi:MAG: HD domain-containing protein [Patescibacteria group bacterium]